MFRHAREDLRDLNAGDIRLDRFEWSANRGRRVGLHIPGVELTRPANQHQLDTVDVFVGRHRTGSLEFQKLRHRQAQECEGPGVQKVTSSHTVAEVNAFVSVESKHRSPYPRQDLCGTQAEL